MDLATATPPSSPALTRLVQLAQAADSSEFIHYATAAFSDDVEHDGLRVLLIRRLTEHGLVARARAIAEHLSAAMRARPEFQQLVKALVGPGHDGRVNWSQFAPRFRANLAAAQARYPWTGQIVAAWNEAGAQLELHRSRKLNWQVFDSRPGPEHGWRPAFADHRPPGSTDGVMPDATKAEKLGPLVLEGVGLGEHLPWLFAATHDRHSGLARVIYQVETSWLALAVAFHLADWTPFMAQPRVRLCCGPDALEQLERVVGTDAWSVPPKEIFRTHLWTARQAPVEPSVHRLVDQYAQQYVAARSSLEDLYRERDGAWWYRHYTSALAGAGRALRVLGITSRFTTVLKYSMRDALSAFQARGCITQLLIEPDDHSALNGCQIVTTIREFAPDLIFLIDHTRTQLALQVNIPVVTWIQDRLPWLFDRKTGKSLGSLDFCLGFHRRQLVELYGYPAERFLPREMATSPAALLPPQTHDLAALRSAPDPRFACDLAYATNTVESPDAFHARVRHQSDAALTPLLDALFDELRRRQSSDELDGGTWWEEVLGAFERSTGVTLPLEGREQIANQYLRPLADRMLRLQTIEWAVRWADNTGHHFRLYGKGWEQHPAYRCYAGGFIEHGPDLGAAFRSARVNLHAGCNPCLHQRVLDGLAAGGFMLVRRHAGDRATGQRRWLDEVDLTNGDSALEVGQLPAGKRPSALDPIAGTGQADDPLAAGDIWPELDQVTFGTYDEFAARLNWWLDHTPERWALADTMRARMLKIFSYESVVAHLLGWMTKQLSAATHTVKVERRR